ncbi:hypothetical protein [Haladaptatus sp. DFWS20]|uniref:hypothetical protein n=1 Tax=Haladaptatus sp. DFWS20 TaxID=3403467 RepID=UPI003EB8D013
MTERGAESGNRGDSQAEQQGWGTKNATIGIILLAVLVSSVAVTVVFGATAGIDSTTNGLVAVGESTSDNGDRTTDVGAGAGVDAATAKATTETMDSCVPEAGGGLLWHLERYGAGCPSARNGKSPVSTNGDGS